MAGRDLQALCEVLVSRTPTSDLQVFVTDQIPEPVGARVLGCVLQLANAAEGARAWWQYAAGAGDVAAAYCLYLHHRALGESGAAGCWYRQTGLDADRGHGWRGRGDSAAGHAPVVEADTSTPTLLRVFRNLAQRTSRPRTEAVSALMHYLPTAVAIGYVNDEPDIDLSLPGPGFAEQHTRPAGTGTAPRAAAQAPQEEGRARPLPGGDRTVGSGKPLTAGAGGGQRDPAVRDPAAEISLDEGAELRDREVADLCEGLAPREPPRFPAPVGRAGVGGVDAYLAPAAPRRAGGRLHARDDASAACRVVRQQP